MPNRDEVVQQALALSPDDRAYVAELLEQSLAPDAERCTSEELLTELERRSTAYRNGTMTARSGAGILAEQWDRHRNRT